MLRIRQDKHFWGIHARTSRQGSCSQRSSRPHRLARKGALGSIELLLSLPVLLFVLLGVIQFATMSVGLQQVALAARVGALEASRTPGLGGQSDVPQNVIDAIETQLISSGIDWTRIRLEHNVGTPSLLIAPSGASDSPPHFQQDPATGEFVRLTVIIRLKEIMPFDPPWFDLQDQRVAKSTVVLPYCGTQ